MQTCSTCKKEFKPVPPLASLNRVQPLVEVHAEWKDKVAGVATVRVTVKSNREPGMKMALVFFAGVVVFFFLRLLGPG